jgi:hypothetical protein
VPFRLAPAVVALALAVALTGCSDDADQPEAGEGSASPSESANPDATLPATVAQAITPTHLDPVCGDGRFTEADDVLGTLPEEYAEQAERILTYDCAGKIDQVVWAEFADSDVSAELLDAETNPPGGAARFVAASTALVVDGRLIEKRGLDVTAYFEELGAACGCGEWLLS